MEEKEQYPAAQERIEKQKELFLEQLRKTPIIQVVCEKVGVGRTSLYRWRKDDPVFDEAIREAIELGTHLVNDLAESKLIKLVQDGDFGPIRFWLQTHHHKYANHLRVSIDKPRDELTDEEKAEISTSLQNFKLLPQEPNEPYDKPNESGDQH